MRYQIIIKRSAEKELNALPATLRSRIAARLLDLEDNPRPAGIKKLQGEESYRLRIGDYRVLLAIDDRKQQVIVYAIGHRREVYR
jgi:mRNA interferase RelE/StbE